MKSERTFIAAFANLCISNTFSLILLFAVRALKISSSSWERPVNRELVRFPLSLLKRIVLLATACKLQGAKLEVSDWTFGYGAWGFEAPQYLFLYRDPGVYLEKFSAFTAEFCEFSQTM